MGAREGWVLIVASLALAACGSSQPAAQGAAAGNVKTRPTGAALDRDTVRAVSAAHSTVPIDLRFELKERPTLNAATDVELALVPDGNTAINHIRLSFQSVDGLDLANPDPVSYDKPEPGVAITQNIGVVPRRAGVLYFTVTALIDNDDGSLSRSYTIPLVVGAG
ncbi:MAG TPA: hypothetical protein VMI92_08135 [Steroidobacteraceae bacterium]|nr:hypothetical protein [Steroidobacteraceae bacterium]